METKNLKAVLASQAVNPVASRAIGKIGFGEGGNVATPDDTKLTNPYIKPILGYAVNQDNSITVNYNLQYGEANGKTIREIGLYCNDGTTLITREVRDIIIKDEDTAIEGQITIVL